MKLIDYMKDNDLSMTQLASKCDLSYFQIYRLLHGKNQALTPFCKVVYHTDGQVGFDDLVPDEVKKQTERKVDHTN